MDKLKQAILILLVTAATSEAQNISSVQPSSGAKGTQVRIYGSGFDATASNNTVTFGGTQATIDSAEATVIYATVPSGESGPVGIEVSVNNTTLKSPNLFTVVTEGSSVFNKQEELTKEFFIDDKIGDTGDYDNDGDVDFVALGTKKALYRNEGNGEFIPHEAGLPIINFATFGDYDQDGDLDLATAGLSPQDYGTAVYSNDGNGNFTHAVSLQGVIDGKADWGDYDQDGDLDLVVIGREDKLKDEESTTIYRNDGNNNFTEIGASIVGVAEGSVDWGDFDSDNDLDLVVTGVDKDGNLIASIYENQGGSFIENQSLTGVYASSSRWADYDQDGDLDLVIGGDNIHDSRDNAFLKIYKNENGDLSPINTGLDGIIYGSVDWSDFDADGDLDLLTTSNIGSTIVHTHLYANVGNDVFSLISDSLNNENFPMQSLWFDYDKNGIQDVIIVSEENTDFEIYRNEAAIGPPEAKSAEYSSGNISANWYGTVAFGLNNYNIYRDTTPIDSSQGPSAFTPAYTVSPDHSSGLMQSYSDADVQKGTTYYYRFTAVSSKYGESGFSSQVVTSVPRDLSISNIDPLSGTAGTAVTIKGSGFDEQASNTVSFGSAQATIDSSNSNTLYVKVPTSIKGPVTITVNNGENTVSSSKLFTGLTQGGDSFIESHVRLDNVNFTAMDWGDYDNDGDLDLIAAGEDSTQQKGITKLYRQEGSRTFTTVETDIPNIQEGSLEWGDYNQDGDLDLYISGELNPDEGGFSFTEYTATIFRNEGDGTFTDTKQDLSTGKADWGDYDQDGDLDLVISGDETKIYENKSNRTFSVEATIGGISASDIEWGDVDGDGDLDLAITGNPDTFSSDEATYIYENLGSGTFFPIQSDVLGVQNGTISWGDYNSDGNPDLLLTGYESYYDKTFTKVYKNNGDKTFTDINAGLNGIENGSADWGDYDADGDLDILVAGDSNDDSNDLGASATIYRNDGNDSFSSQTSITPGIIQGTTSWADYDKDGDLDFFISGRVHFQNDSNLFTKIYRNGGLGTPDAIKITGIKPQSGTSGTAIHIDGVGFDLTPSNNTVTIGDVTANVDSAGLRDLYATVPSGLQGPVNVTVDNSQANSDLTGVFTAVTGGGQFTETDKLFQGLQESSIDWGDYDSDGDPDLVMTGNAATGFDTDLKTKIYRNEGNGSFKDIKADIEGFRIGSVSWGDYDTDGDLDLVLSGENNNEEPSTKIYENKGNDTFTDINAGLFGVDNSSADWGDYDEDGDLDLVIIGQENNDHHIKLYKNTGNNNFKNVETNLSSAYQGAVRWGDYNGDGAPDLLITGRETANIYRNNKDGTFTKIDAGLTPVDYSFAEWIDYDQDGYLDITITGEDPDFNSTTTIYENNGNGEFTPIDAGISGAVRDVGLNEWGDHFTWGDYDADGDPDLLIEARIGDLDFKVKLYENEGDNKFSAISSTITSAPGGSLEWVDFNSDGKLDVFSVGSNTAKLYKNKELVLPASPQNLTLKIEPEGPSISWGKSPEDNIAKYIIFQGASVSELTLQTTVSASTTSKNFFDLDKSGVFAVKAETESGIRSTFAGPVSYVNREEELANQWQLIGNSTASELSLSDGIQSYRFDKAYVSDNTLSPAVGSWVKSRSNKVLDIRGNGLVNDTLKLSKGWNLIGSLSDTAVVSDPNGILNSTPIYRFNISSMSYKTTQKLHPGQGHWIHTDQNGEVVLNIDTELEGSEKEKPHSEKKKLDRITFSSRGISQTFFYSSDPLSKEKHEAYRLPPKAPEPLLDVRTNDGYRVGYGSSVRLNITAEENPVRISLSKNEENKMAYRIEIQDGEREIILPLTEQKSQTISQEYDNIRLKRMAKHKVAVENKFSPNYPNPFNPATIIEYQVASQSEVQMNIYNILGQKVRTLVNATKQPGRYEARFDGSDLASGVYYLRIQIGQFTDLQKMTLIK